MLDNTLKITYPSGHSDSFEEGLDYAKSCVSPGWALLLTHLMIDLAEMGWDGTLYQVKEKFGGLRFYIGYGSDEVFKRISLAEEESHRTCEKCGATGQTHHLNGGYWLMTLCEACLEKEED